MLKIFFIQKKNIPFKDVMLKWEFMAIVSFLYYLNFQQQQKNVSLSTVPSLYLYTSKWRKKSVPQEITGVRSFFLRPNFFISSWFLNIKGEGNTKIIIIKSFEKTNNQKLFSCVGSLVEKCSKACTIVFHFFCGRLIKEKKSRKSLLLIKELLGEGSI